MGDLLPAGLRPDAETQQAPDPVAQGQVGTARTVVVNGQRLGPDGLAQVDALNCGATVPDGSYWLDLQQRRWGYTHDSEVHALADCNAPSFQAAEPLAQQASEGDGGEEACAAQYHYQEDINCYCRNICITWPSGTTPGSASIVLPR